MRDTKQRILEAALVMFAERGYEGTNMRELAQALGLGKSALYKHYQSKEDIWNSLLDQLEAHYSQHVVTTQNETATPASWDEFRSLAQGMLDFTLNDERIRLARQLLLAEQFHDDRARRLASEHFLTRFEELFAPLFAGMAEAGLLEADDPSLLALEFSAPITVLIMECDRNPASRERVVERIHAFMEHFVATHQSA